MKVKLPVNVVFSVSVDEQVDHALMMGDEQAHAAFKSALCRALSALGDEVQVHSLDMGQFNVVLPE